MTRSDALEPRVLTLLDLPRAECEVDGIKIHAPHPLAHPVAVANLFQRVAAIQPLDRRGNQRLVYVVL